MPRSVQSFITGAAAEAGGRPDARPPSAAAPRINFQEDGRGRGQNNRDQTTHSHTERERDRRRVERKRLVRSRGPGNGGSRRRRRRRVQICGSHAHVAQQKPPRWDALRFHAVRPSGVQTRKMGGRADHRIVEPKAPESPLFKQSTAGSDPTGRRTESGTDGGRVDGPERRHRVPRGSRRFRHRCALFVPSRRADDLGTPTRYTPRPLRTRVPFSQSADGRQGARGGGGDSPRLPSKARTESTFFFVFSQKAIPRRTTAWGVSAHLLHSRTPVIFRLFLCRVASSFALPIPARRHPKRRCENKSDREKEQKINQLFSQEKHRILGGGSGSG